MDELLLNKQQILDEAADRFRKCEDWESTFRSNYSYDVKFENADFQSGGQWDEYWSTANRADGRARLTINKVRQHCLQIINDSLQNKPAIKIDPVGDGATHEASEIIEGIVRHIWYTSNADDAIDTAYKSMVIGGYGCWRIRTDYVDDNSFDQEIRIERIPDCLTTYLDPNIVELDGSDATFGFIFSDWDEDTFALQFPKWKGKVSGRSIFGENQPNTSNLPSLDASKIRVGEYFRRVEDSHTLLLLEDGSTVTESEFDRDDPRKVVNSREVLDHRVEWFLIAGDQVIEQRDWMGRYIPLVRIVADETVIDGTMDRKGMTRALVDSQRMYNVHVSAAVEALQNQTKVAWIISKQAVEGSETQWSSANRNNYAYLTWNEFSDTGQENPNSKPERIDPPVYSQGYQQGIVQAAQDMMMASGQYQSTFGENSNERSGKAINERQRQGENATYHFINALAVGIRYTGKIILDLLPHVYDTERALLVLGEDAKQTQVALDPNLPTAHAELPEFDYSPQSVTMALNPNVGRYSVQANVGPSYGTRRQETFNAVSQIIQEVPGLTNVIGDLLFRSMDVPLADEIADRMKNMLAPAALGKGPSPQEQQLQGMLAQQHMVMTQQQDRIKELESKTAIELMQKDIDMYKALTDRQKVVAATDPEAMRLIFREELSQMMGASANAIIHEHAVEQAVSQAIVGGINPQAVGAAPPDGQPQAAGPQQ